MSGSGVDKVLDFMKITRISLSDCSKKILFLTACLLIASCSHDPARVIVTDLRSPPKVTSGQHIVQRGETLYAIAWFYSRDFRELAQNNNIRSPYTIYPGQKINLSIRRYEAVKPSGTPASQPKEVVAKSNVPVKKYTMKSPAQKSSSFTSGGWQWPADGKIISAYSLQMPVNKGIDIGGKLGEPVKAAASGKVVYAGSDLSGYGRLIILKHNSSYLSAYAHNRDLLVHEGDSVKAGQKIAEIGSTGTTEPKLHFEIRRDGKPVDPMGYLPGR
ncbi:peptidoglycan DD-metalloendopeptidase family protein [Endozoicomonas sp. SCSIO W0465]|uniref:peptidoglycan DD-metalloendopeptidase family protein n=1 Tax=Endozoicomonas sp. SCSIO W0465 TaxID=2918516 RepID=UPI002075B78C|nr:peptidoglycan DD-metalloendopeptidase family protein [Endozoicomonas sp. SCSIO W0465]USE33965.1 peptidoglycan DD-metalloendopeptidase family protein [Endozoicomonas sp. SCSIO W0465]